MRQKEYNKHAATALISAVYRAPRLSLCVCRTFTLSLKVQRLVKSHNPWIAALFQGLRYFPRENALRFTESQCIGKNCGSFGKKRHNTLPAQNPEANHKSVARFLSKHGLSILMSVAFFLTYTVLWIVLNSFPFLFTSFPSLVSPTVILTTDLQLSLISLPLLPSSFLSFLLFCT